jgi:hypothetical protein
MPYLLPTVCTVGIWPFGLPLRYASMPLIKKAIGLFKFPADMDRLQCSIRIGGLFTTPCKPLRPIAACFAPQQLQYVASIQTFKTQNAKMDYGVLYPRSYLGSALLGRRTLLAS